MEEWVVADLHFDHENVIKFCNRPFENVSQMNQYLIDGWNSVVGKKDKVRILGDFAWNRHGYFINVLNGKKELVIGSHDKMSRNYLNCFSKVSYIDYFKYNNREFVASHCCPRIWEKSHYGSIALFGHSHGKIKTYNLSFDVGVDATNNQFKPIHMDTIIQWANQREDQMDKQGRISYIERKGNIIKMFDQDDVEFFNKNK